MSRDIHAPIEYEEDDVLNRRALAGKIYARLRALRQVGLP